VAGAIHASELKSPVGARSSDSGHCQTADIGRSDEAPNRLGIIPGNLKATDIETLPYPGFPTDMQAQFMALR